MCGIYGYFGNLPNETEKRELIANHVKNLAIETESRGKHSTGFFAVNEDKIFMSKRAIRARHFVKNDSIDNAIVKDGCSIFVGHNRMASVGSITNKNAHPFQGKNYTLVHNGSVGKPDTLKLELGIPSAKLPKNCTDTEVFLRALDTKKTLVKLAKKVSGYSFVIYDHDQDKLFFVRDRFPLVVFNTTKLFGVRFFGSEKEIMQKAIDRTFKWANGHCEGFSFFSTLPYRVYEAKIDSQEIKALPKVDTRPERFVFNGVEYTRYNSYGYQDFYSRYIDDGDDKVVREYIEDKATREYDAYRGFYRSIWP